MIASGSVDKTVRLWDVSGKALRSFEGHSDSVVSVAFSPDGKTTAPLTRTTHLCSRKRTQVCVLVSHRPRSTEPGQEGGVRLGLERPRPGRGVAGAIRVASRVSRRRPS